MTFPRLRGPTATRLRQTTTITTNTPYTRPIYHRTFTSSTPHYSPTAREPTYYEILDVPPTATQAEIKKKFYALSLQHHPDRNRDDPSASNRFAQISSAYNTLSNATKRSIYDRDHHIHIHASSTHSTANPGQHPMGSYSSYSANLHTKGASYAGSRPASGLSKRRGQFRGPPPSFYAHGGYGGTGRRAGAGAGVGGEGSGGGSAKGTAEDDPTSFIHRNTVWHFNAKGHYRTQTREDERRQERRSREMAGASHINDKYLGSPGAMAVRFIVVCGILMGAGAMTGVWNGDRAGGQTKTTKSVGRKEG
ncbi:DnaJ domain protein [Aspergillus neoniger CBS 115656]|uniref:DnaJ domain protein n=1 Tax=Aspergillus neoniger (strain CBS 115656) TaxID=1448310 RepID=A0A318Z8B4_ASPNB|nr:DnaJ domain protein [Aspergillus neoniger CBS 115656]PYH36488.1 DnaJ domain protein [Aspergillus neoniger CBS 115656]